MNIEKIILGTVQFGLDYGINNISGKPGGKEVFKILNYASRMGINFLDTAEAYGNAHQILGDYNRHHTTNKFRTVTKFPSDQKPLDVRKKIAGYLKDLSLPTLWGVMFHSFESLEIGTRYFSELTSLKQEKIIEHVGVSVYTNEEALQALNYDPIDFIQLPFNLLDNDMKRGEVIRAIRRAGKMVHTRSAFLQGLFFKKLEYYPENLMPLRKYVSELHDIISLTHYSMEDVCLLYAINHTEIQGVVIGVDNHNQLEQNMKNIGKSLPPKIIERINSIDVKETELLYPKNWK
jgi:aryl-alcohol dehydrogenase-like predicted oxidoreductase